MEDVCVQIGTESECREWARSYPKKSGGGARQDAMAVAAASMAIDDEPVDDRLRRDYKETSCTA
jgi:hypothetical protein